MQVNLDDLKPFEDICRNICVNIPSSCSWQWDDKHLMAVVTLEEEDAELVFYPLFKEFQSHWNFESTPEVAKEVTSFVDEKYGLMPGQVFFTSHTLCNLVLAVAWWPWGSDRKVSMRVGLIPVNQEQLEQDTLYACMTRWLDIQGVTA